MTKKYILSKQTIQDIKIFAPLFLGGILTHLMFQKFALRITPIFLITAIAIVLSKQQKESNLTKWFIATSIVTIIIEIIGSKIGLIFGDYTYLSTLWPFVAGVPILIGPLWVLMILGAIKLAQTVTKNKIIQVILTGIFTVMIDLPIEIIAPKLNYWRFFPQVGWQNSLAWCVISVIFAIPLIKRKTHITKTAQNYVIMQTIFFIALALTI